MRQLDVGFIGCGSIAHNHADRVQQLDENVAAAADIDENARAAFVDEYGADAGYEDFEAMLATEDLDAVVVSVPNFLHADCAIAALAEDVNVLVEKPLAHTYEDALRIWEAAADSDAQVMVGFVRAFSSWFEDFRDRAAAGEFGDIYDVDVESVRRRGIPQLGSWFTQKNRSGGGVMIDVGVHVLHLALALLEFPQVESVSASTGANFGSKDDYTYLNMWGGDPIEDATFDVEDYIRAVIRTADGTTIHLHSAWASNTDPRQSFRVQGDEGGASAGLGGGDPTVHSTDRDALSDTTLDLADADTFRAEWEYFTAVVRGDRQHTRNTLEEGVAVQRVIEAMYRSAEGRREVAGSALPK